MLQGATVIDGPEYPRYSTINQGRLMPCYKNMTGDIFRKVLDGTIQIPTVNQSGPTARLSMCAMRRPVWLMK